MATNKQPNIIMISTDQQRADHLSCYGNKILKTPSIDKLADKGTRFDRCYVTSPVCMPNRASLMTGRMPSLHGVRHNGLDLDWSTVTIADLLASAGWSTSLIGKAHLQCMTSNPPLMGTNRQLDRDALLELSEAKKSSGNYYGQENRQKWYDDPEHDLIYPYYGFQTVKLAIEHGDQVGGHYARWLAQHTDNSEKLSGPKNALVGKKRVAPQCWRTAVPEELYPTKYIEHKTINKLKELSGNRKNPFFIWCSFCDPHHPFTPPGRYWDLYDPADVELPKSFYSDENCFDIKSKLIQDRQTGRAGLNGSSAIAVTEEEARDAIALTYGAISMIDDAIGNIVKTLEDEELLSNTIIIFTSDHGDFMGDHKLLFKGPIHLQSLIRIPLIWMDGRQHRKQTTANLCSTMDISNSILSVAGIRPFNGMQGQALFDSSGNITNFNRDAVLIEDEVQYCLPQTDIRGRARTLVTEQWRLTIYDGIEEGQLVNIVNDPLEGRNLWNDLGTNNVRSELIEVMTRMLISNSETSPKPKYAA